MFNRKPGNASKGVPLGLINGSDTHASLRCDFSAGPVIKNRFLGDFSRNLIWKTRYAYGKKQVVDGLLVVIPKEHEGALETVMLDSISENSYDAVIVDKVAAFVKEMRTIASKYISSDRKELKARLGVTWAIQYPEKVFKLINEQIKSVAWEDSEVLKSCFGELIKI